jgi:hypothetical protein
MPGWTIDAVQDWHTITRHVLPRFDVRQHDRSVWCWCVPMLHDEGTVVVHHSLDGRENNE